MSFGAVQSAISSLKSNRNLINKRKRNKSILGNTKGFAPLMFEKRASSEKLEEIRSKLQKERKERQKKILIIFSVFMLLLLSVIVYFF